LFLVLDALCVVVLICRESALNLQFLLQKDCQTLMVEGSGLEILNLRKINYE
jgi:hypothetical protein